jgi:DNA-directed RNA polymerase beta' subunit
MRKDEGGALGKSSFEESLENFLQAAANGDIEPTRGVSASIICGKRARIGTGIMDLKIDINQLPKAPPIITNVSEHKSV